MLRFFISSIFLFSALETFAGSKVPACMDRTTRLEFNEGQVLTWRDHAESKFVGRALVRGVIVRVMEDRQQHVHFEIDFDGNFATDDDRIEIVYSTKFGPVPRFDQGDELIACGDFVKDSYSPLGGVVHWLHLNPNKDGVKAHDHGFMIINGVLAGQESKP